MTPSDLASRIAALIAAVAVAPAASAAVGCRLAAEVSPEPAVVGQQILHRVHIERDPDVRSIEWLDSPRFADFRAEWLPGGPERRGVSEDGAPIWTREERRALFPLRAGELVVSAGRIACLREDTAGAPARIDEVDLAALRIRVESAPHAGRPDDWSGLVGRVRLQISSLPERIELGQSLRVSITLRGETNVWDAAPLLDQDAVATGSVRAEFFTLESELQFERGTRLQARRTDRIDVVPRALGSLELRTRAPSYYDAEREAYSRAEPISAQVEVVPAGSLGAAGPALRAPASAPSDERPDSQALPPAEQGSSMPSGWPLLLGGLVALAACVPLLGLFVVRRCGDRRNVARAMSRAEASQHPREQAAALEHAIRSAIAKHAEGIAGLSPGDMRAAASNDALMVRAARALADLEAIRFGETDDRPNLAEIGELVTRVTRRSGPSPW